MTFNEVCEALGITRRDAVILILAGALRVDEDSVAEYIAAHLPSPA